MAAADQTYLIPPLSDENESNAPSLSFNGSQDDLIRVDTAEDSIQYAAADTVPDAPAHIERVVAENPAQATNRRIISLEPKVVRPINAQENPDLNDLNFWPTILEKKAVVMLVLLYALTAASIAALMWKALQDSNNSFRLSSENVRMISRYFPSIVGTVTVLLFRQTVREALRMEPFTKMADDKNGQNPGSPPAHSIGGAWFPWQSITTAPLSFLAVFSLLCQVLVSFVVSFKVALLASKTSIDEAKQPYWTLTVRLYPAVLLIMMYILMIAYTLYIPFHFRGKSTGLKWDPVSIADYASLFAHCNALPYLAPLELRHNLRPKHVMVPDRLFRLGYWKRVRDNPHEEDIVYGIGVGFSARVDTGKLLQQERVPLGRPWTHRLTFRKPKEEKPLPVKRCRRPQECNHGTWPKCEHYPYNENPGCSRTSIVLASLASITALGLSIYALVIGLPFRGFTLDNNIRFPDHISINVGSKNHTLPPIDPADPNSSVLIWALVFRSAPTYLAGLFTSSIISSIDLNMRFMQPFRNMFGEAQKKPLYWRIRNFLGLRHRWTFLSSEASLSDEQRVPAKAAESILLAYITVSPLQVPLTAWDKKHYKVCIYSTLNTLSPLFPIFVGGLISLTLDEGTNKVHFTFSLSAYIGVMVSLVLFSLLLPAAIPGAYRLLPRQLYSLADLMALCYQAKFMASPHLDITHRDRTPSKHHMEARILLTDDRFLFGVYQGRDNQSHIGFDVIQQREHDFGPIKTLPNSVRHIPPEGITHFIQRGATVAMEEGRRAMKRVAGTIRRSRRSRSPAVRVGRPGDDDEREEQEQIELQSRGGVVEASGAEPWEDSEAHYAVPRKPVATHGYQRLDA